MRLIDADALEKDLNREYNFVYQKFHAAKREDEKTEYGAAGLTWLQAIFRARKAPTVDAIEVVRCKDCAKRNTAKCSMRCGGSFKVQIRWEADNDFCSWGERKTDDRR
uniref:Uncharacterized protein n=1 Tax=Siphoviridae sp. ctDmR33 TaxID=2825389 RepID=A0A8S5UXF7_9CAUD|nr:MAG TPA: hypothetical protein [Siphoviridae sp. ctDmR33]